jgi:hypothetical protein
MSWAGIHRRFAIGLAVLLGIWTVTGLLFHLKPGWDRAYDMLGVERRDVPLATPTASIADVQKEVALPISKLELFDTAIGPLYRVSHKMGADLVDARTGRRRSPLDEAAVRTLVGDAISRSTHAADYGEIERVAMADDLNGGNPTRVEMSSGITVEISVRNARISQRGSDTDRIDWLYRIHYLQWTGHKSIDRVLSILGLLLVWAVVIPGLVLLKRRVWPAKSVARAAAAP